MSSKVAHKPVAFASILATCCFYSGYLSASEPLILKSSVALNSLNHYASAPASRLGSSPSLLGNINLLRGVLVEPDRPTRETASADINAQAATPDKKSSMALGAGYGGLRVLFPGNFSLVYSPQRSSNPSMNGESEGLYLISHQGGFSNWFVGVQSHDYFAGSNLRRTHNLAQAGVILNLQ